MLRKSWIIADGQEITDSLQCKFGSSLNEHNFFFFFAHKESKMKRLNL